MNHADVKKGRHYNECRRLAAFFNAVWTEASGLVWPHALLHDLLTQVACRSQQHCILVLGIIDAFVYAADYHWHNVKNHGTFHDPIKGRMRMMTTINPAYAHVISHLCLNNTRDEIFTKHFQPLKPKATHRVLPTSVRQPVRLASFFKMGELH